MTLAISKLPGSGCGAFGRSLQDLARAGRPPIVLHDCLRWLSKHGLHIPTPFAAVGDKRKLLALKQLYETGKRPLRNNKVINKEPVVVANLLLLWLGSLPEPLFPQEYVPELLHTQHSDCYLDRVAAVRGFLKKTEPFILEALFPLFEFLHHHLINQADRDAALQELGRLFAPFIFGTPQEYGMPPEDASLLADTVELMIAEYRPLFTQPYGLNRYEQDTARAQAAAAAKVAQHHLPVEGGCSPLAAASLGLAPVAIGPRREEWAEGEQGKFAQFWTPFSYFADSPVHGGSEDDEEGSPRHDVEAAMEGMLSSLLESTVFGLFEDPLGMLAGEDGMHQEVAAPDGPIAAPPARVPSPARAVPVPGNKHRLAQEAAAAAAADEELAGESYTSDDWSSFSPTGVILGSSAPYGCVGRVAADPAAGVAAVVEPHGAWGCNPASRCGVGAAAGGLPQLGGGSSHVLV